MPPQRRLRYAAQKAILDAGDIPQSHTAQDPALYGLFAVKGKVDAGSLPHHIQDCVQPAESWLPRVFRLPRNRDVGMPRNPRQFRGDLRRGQDEIGARCRRRLLTARRGVATA